METFADYLKKEGVLLKNFNNIIPDNKRRLLEDEFGKKNIYVQLSEDSCYGTYYNCKTGDSNYWLSKGNDSLSKKEKEKLKNKNKLARKKAEEEKKALEKKRKKEIIKSFLKMPACTEHLYLKKKNITAKPFMKLYKDRLYIPMVGVEGDLWNIQSIDEDGNKLFQYACRKNETFFPIRWKPSEGIPETLVICEGVATGCSINESTKLSVACAMDVNNVLKVVAVIRKKAPKCKIIIAADNDQWRFKTPRNKEVKKIISKEVSGDNPLWDEWRGKGFLYNIGLEKAKECGLKYETFVVYPDIPKNDKKKRTDFNDLHNMFGSDAVLRDFNAVLNPPKEKEEIEYTSDQAPEENNGEEEHIKAIVEDLRKQEGNAVTPEQIIAAFNDGFFINESGDRLPIRALGYSDKTFYIYSLLDKAVLSMSLPMSPSVLYRVTEEWTWYNFFNSGKKLSEKELVKKAERLIVRGCQKRGTYEVGETERGSGIWLEGEDTVINYGKDIRINGEHANLTELCGDNVYVLGRKKIAKAKKEVTQGECTELIRVCKKALWTNALSGELLAGWIVSSMACATFDWRAHLWIAGLSGSGKTTLVEKLISKVLKVTAARLDQGSTEAAIRDVIRNDGIPLISDEMEGEDKRAKLALQDILKLVKGASSGVSIKKYGQGTRTFRFAACFVAINPILENEATKNRIIQLNLNAVKLGDNNDDFAEWILDINSLVKKDFSARLFNTVANNVRTLLKNQDVFATAFLKARVTGRTADQLSYPMAGLWLLKTREVVTLKEAIEYIRKYDWSEFTDSNKKPESERLIEYLSKISVTVKTELTTKDMTIGSLVVCAARNNNELSMTKANDILAQFNMKVRDNRLFIATESAQIARLLRDKPQWSSGTQGWRNIIRHYNGAKVHSKCTFSQGSIPSEAISIPVSVFFVAEQQRFSSYIKDTENEEEVSW